MDFVAWIARLTVLIVGGYGTFGGRLARLLSDADGLTLLIGGRSLGRAQEFCSREGAGRLEAVCFDRDAPVPGTCNCGRWHPMWSWMRRGRSNPTAIARTGSWRPVSIAEFTTWTWRIARRSLAASGVSTSLRASEGCSY